MKTDTTANCSGFSDALGAYLAEGSSSSSLRHAPGCSSCWEKLKNEAPELQFMLLSEAPIQPQLLAKIQVALPSRRLVPGRLLRIAASALVTVGLIWAASSYITKTSSPPPVAKIISDPGTAIGPSRHEGPIALTSIEELRERYPLIARVETEGARYYQDTAEDGTRLVFFYVPEI